MKVFLDPSYCSNFRETINKTPIFIYDAEYKVHHNLFCAVMDRLDSSIEYLNKHSSPPKTEEELLLFIMYSCMVVDAVKFVLCELGIKSIYEDLSKTETYRFFKKICLEDPLNLSEKQCPTDDKFFEYFRSTTFAHPFETNRPKFFQRDEIQYSPWVIANSKFMTLRGVKNGIGVRIYSNRFNEIKDLIFPLETLKEYIISRYIQIQKATYKIKVIILKKERKWKAVKVNRTLSPLDTLKEISEILNIRYESNFAIETTILYLECESTLETNDIAISKFRKAIIEKIPTICDATDELNYEKLEETLAEVLHVRPKVTHSLAHYQLGKIFTNYNEMKDSSNKSWDQLNVEAFSKEFAKKWVIIVPKTMCLTEIKLLVTVACYLEKEQQEKEAIG